MKVSNDLDNGSQNKQEKKSSFGVRQFILFGVLLLVLTAFLVDKYHLMPSAQKKIELMENEITKELNDENRNMVHERIGKPNSTFTYKGLEIEQYRFARGLPFYRKPVLDIAYKGGAIAFYSLEPITNEYVDSKLSTTKVSDLKEGERDIEIIGVGMGQ